MNEIIEIIKYLSKIRDDTIISGSVAGMLYLKKEIRKCNDIDIQLKYPLRDSDIEKINNKYPIKQYENNSIILNNGKEIDIYYNDIPYTIIDDCKVMELERLLANKINRCFSNPKYKDIYDLYFLLDLKYNINILNSYLKKYENNDIILLDKKNDSIYYEIDIEKAKNIILSIRR